MADQTGKTLLTCETLSTTDDGELTLDPGDATTGAPKITRPANEVAKAIANKVVAAMFTRLYEPRIDALLGNMADKPDGKPVKK